MANGLGRIRGRRRPAPLDGLEVGVSGLCHALSALGCLTAASCRAHPGPHSWTECPVVLFRAETWRVELLADLISAEGCGLGEDRDMPRSTRPRCAKYTPWPSARWRNEAGFGRCPTTGDHKAQHRRSQGAPSSAFCRTRVEHVRRNRVVDGPTAKGTDYCHVRAQLLEDAATGASSGGRMSRMSARRSRPAPIAAMVPGTTASRAMPLPSK